MDSTLFRFVTVRGVQKPTKARRDTAFIRYSADEASPLVREGSELLTAMAKAGRVDNALFAQSMRKIAFKSVSAGEAFTNPSDLLNAIDHLDHWVEAIEDSRLSLDLQALKQLLDHHKLAPNRAAVGKIWTSLVAGYYHALPVKMVQSATMALKAIHLARFLSTADPRELKDPEAQISDRLEATVLLPFRLDLPTEVGGAVDPRAGDDKPVAGPAPLPPQRDASRLEALEGLMRDLRDFQVIRLAEARAKAASIPVIIGKPASPDEGKDDPAPSQEPANLLGTIKEAAASLAPKNRNLLAKFSLSEDMPVLHAINHIEVQASREGARLAGKVRPVEKVVQTGGSFWKQPISAKQPPHKKPDRKPKPSGDDYDGMFGEGPCAIRPLGIADFRRVEQTLHCYEPGEIAHIENVLQGETKLRSTRRLSRSEESLITTEERETIDERDTQTTDRFELEQETTKEVENSFAFDLGVSVAAGYGPVSIEVSSNLAISTASKESAKKASTYAKDITERASQRVREAVSTQRSSTTINEFEETNTHTLDNSEGDHHTVGLYRWINKVYEAKIVNYGKRLMFEFLIPEPAAFHLHAMTDAPAEDGVALERPIDPRTAAIEDIAGQAPITDATRISVGNYALWAALYDASVSPPPAAYVSISRGFSRENLEQDQQFSSSNNEIALPPGYEATTASWSWGLHSATPASGRNWLTIVVGNQSHFDYNGGSVSGRVLNGLDSTIAVTIMGKTRMYGINVEITGARTPEAYAAWQIATFDSIIAAYNDKLSAYNNALAEAKARAGVAIRGSNPLLNRQIEQQELKKGALQLVAKCNLPWSDAMQDGTAETCFQPQFDCCEAISDGSHVQFLEQAFEWSLMTYTFYPYFWGRKCNWVNIYRLDDADPVFLNFLQAGYARVIVPVRPGYHKAIMRYLVDGTLWDGGDVPGVDSDMFVAVDAELREPVGLVDPDVEPWLITVPTSLTALQCESGCIEGKGLPCPGGEPEWGLSTPGTLNPAPADPEDPAPDPVTDPATDPATDPVVDHPHDDGHDHHDGE